MLNFSFSLLFFSIVTFWCFDTFLPPAYRWHYADILFGILTSPITGYNWLKMFYLEEIFAYHVYSSIVHCSQEVEATHMSTDGWMDKWNVVYIFHTMELKRKKGLSYVTTLKTCSVNSASHEKITTVWFHYMRYLKDSDS